MIQFVAAIESIESSDHVADFDSWNSSVDSFSFLYNPDPWQQGGASTAELLTFYLAGHQGVTRQVYVWGKLLSKRCSDQGACFAENSGPWGTALVELGDFTLRSRAAAAGGRH